MFGVGRFRSVEVVFWRPTSRSILDRSTENDFFEKNCFFHNVNQIYFLWQNDLISRKFFVKFSAVLKQLFSATIFPSNYLFMCVFYLLIFILVYESKFSFNCIDKTQQKVDFTEFFFKNRERKSPQFLPLWKTRNSISPKNISSNQLFSNVTYLK